MAEEALVRCYVLRLDEVRGQCERLLSSVAPRYAACARNMFERGTAGAEKAGLCQLGEGWLLRDICGVERDEQIVIGKFGKPDLASGTQHVSITNTDDLVVLAVAGEVVGVDAEPVKDEGPSRIELLTLAKALGVPREERGESLERMAVLAPNPLELARQWTRVEAILKGIGCGFGVEPAEYLPLMEAWQCAWVQHAGCVICAATQTMPHIELEEFASRC